MYIYVYIYIYICVYVYIYICIYNWRLSITMCPLLRSCSNKDLSTRRCPHNCGNCKKSTQKWPNFDSALTVE